MVDSLGRPVVLGASRLEEVTGSLGKGCNRPVVLNSAGVSGLIASLLSPVLDAFFLFFMTQVWDLLVSEPMV